MDTLEDETCSEHGCTTVNDTVNDCPLPWAASPLEPVAMTETRALYEPGGSPTTFGPTKKVPNWPLPINDPELFESVSQGAAPMTWTLQLRGQLQLPVAVSVIDCGVTLTVSCKISPNVS